MLESEFNDVAENLKEIISLLVQFTDGLSGADIKKLSDRTKRRVILHDVDYAEAIIQELLQFKNDGSIEFNKKFAKLAHEQVRIPIRTIAKWLGKSSSAVQYYLKK